MDHLCVLFSQPHSLFQRFEIPEHSLTTDGGSMDHQLVLQKVHNGKQYQQEYIVASSDPDVLNMHL